MIEINNTTRHRPDLKRVKELVELFLKYNKLKKKEVSLAFVGDKRIREINNQYRGQDKTTDILSFEGEGDFLGEILVNLSQIKRQSKRYSPDFLSELDFILVHGLYHLMGYNDDNDQGIKKMNSLTENFLESINRKK